MIMIDAKDVIALLPSVFEGAKVLAGLVSPKAARAVDFGQAITEFIIDAVAKGLSPELIVEKLDEMVLELKASIKFGV